MSKTENIVAILTENRVQLFITLVSVVVAIVNFLIISKLQPLAVNLDAITKRVSAIENNYVESGEFEQVVTRLNYLTSRVDQIYAIIISKK